MQPLDDFRNLSPEFWALVKLASQKLRYSEQATGGVKRYSAAKIEKVLRDRGLDPTGYEQTLQQAAEYVDARAGLLEDCVKPNLMSRDEARVLFQETKKQTSPPKELLTMNKQKGEKRHEAYLTCIVNMLTYDTLNKLHGESVFDSNPKGPLTFARDGMPLRTLFRRMDGAYPNVNHPYAAWEIKEYYGTTTFGSRVADGVYETALDGYELNDLRSVGVVVEHYLFVDDRFTWWNLGRPYLARIVDMLHVGLLSAAFFGREVVREWPSVVANWPASSPAQQ
ncbi:MAG TPA: hypothetical protein VFW38_00075 [Solirubrobacteraceae bacterium]|nr:hypothetical protein [Solirubrobacteraceae bacterium]